MTLAVVMVVTLLGVGTADAAAFLRARVQATIAADAAVLAAADATTWLNDADPTEEASRLALANGASLVSCHCPERALTARATVEVTARAIFLSGWAGRRVRATSSAKPARWVDSWTPP